LAKPLIISSDRVKEHDPFSRLDYDNFSYKEIQSTETVRILSGQQMVVASQIRVDGFLHIEGEALVTTIRDFEPQIELPPDNFSYYQVPSATTVTVPQDQQMYVRDFVRVDGQLRVAGQLAIGNAYQKLPPKRLPSIVPMLESYLVEQDEEYSFRNFLKIDGQVTNKGFITIGA
jgi:hypothetical protein